MVSGKKCRKLKISYCTAKKKTQPKSALKSDADQRKRISELDSTKAVGSVLKKEKDFLNGQHSKKFSKIIIKKLENENECLRECIKIQQVKIKGMESEIKTFQDKFDKMKKDLEELRLVNVKLKEYEVTHEEVVKILLKETDRKDDCEISLKEAINSLSEECSSLAQSESSLQETIRIILNDLERLQSSEAVLNEAIIGYEEEKEREKEKQLCVVCVQVESRVAFVPCGHLVVCSNCSSQLNTCPMCRQSISSAVTVFRQ